MPPPPCQPVVVAAVTHLCQLTASLDAAALRTLLAVPAVRAAEAAVDAAALAGDVALTKRACKVWWTAWRQAIMQLQHITPQERPHV